MIGTVFGHYRVTRKLGQGGVGDVWKAIDLSLDREVALKVLRPDLAAQPEVVARFRAEALALAKLNHPHIATIHGFHVEDACPFMVMEYVRGQTLDAVVRGFGRMQVPRALGLFFQVLEAMQHAHEQGIVHRDLKASNVMLSQLGIVKVLDFGIARQIGSAHLTRGTHGVGTPSWMAPEQIRAEEADARTDVYALGLLLYWLVAARLPFEGDSEFAVQRAHLEQEPPSPRVYAPDLPRAVEKVILRALAKERARRWANVAELRFELGDRRDAGLTRPFQPGAPAEAASGRDAEAERTLVTAPAGSAPAATAPDGVPTRTLGEPGDADATQLHLRAGASPEGCAASAPSSARASVERAPLRTAGARGRPLAWAAAALLAACTLLGVWASASHEPAERATPARRSPLAPAPPAHAADASRPPAAPAAVTARSAPAPPPAAAAGARAASPRAATAAARPAARKEESAGAPSEDAWVIRRD